MNALRFDWFCLNYESVGRPSPRHQGASVNAGLAKTDPVNGPFITSIGPCVQGLRPVDKAMPKAAISR
jgi:hypothetical protein